jgi:pyruvate formate lyase activating enzyme
MEIKGFIDLSLVDWDGKVASVIFLPRCNMRCPFCYNSSFVLHPESHPTIRFEGIMGYLKKNMGWVDGVAITGGEPTLHADLSELCSKLKEMGFLVKLDTNGTNPDIVKELIANGLVDYIAMDVKAPLMEEDYSKVCGVNAKNILGKIRETVRILLNSNVDYEFRTTVVPTLHTKEDIVKISHQIKGCRKYALQNFKGDIDPINPEFKKLKPFTDGEMLGFLEAAKKLVPNTVLR